MSSKRWTPQPVPAPMAATVFKALGDPIRWNIMQQMAQAGELTRSTLEQTVPASKPTISYHAKILIQAGLISAHERGRDLFYALHRDMLQQLADGIWGLAPPLVPSDRIAEEIVLPTW
jgi:DNA-binding transcriptional ArsR family regulator